MSATPSVDNALMSHFSAVYGSIHTAGTDNVIAESDPSSRVQSPRPETPEPYVAQGRRNAPVGVQLLDAKGVISEKVSDTSFYLIWAGILLLASVLLAQLLLEERVSGLFLDFSSIAWID